MTPYTNAEISTSRFGRGGINEFNVEFGYDFLFLMRNMIIQASDEGGMDPVTDALARFFLIDWDLSIEEIDEVNSLFWDRFDKRELEDSEDIVERVKNHLVDNVPAKEK